MKKIKVGVIGLGGRGKNLLEEIILNIEKAVVVSVCDTYIDRAQDGAKAVKDKCGYEPDIQTDYKKVIENKDVEAVIIMSSWESHVDIATMAMEAGKAVAMEVGGAYAVADCWKLVDTYEKTKTPFMFLENCCFGKRELMVLNMVEQGVFGEIVHCSGCYAHDLREEISFGKENRHYRLNNYIERNCENYPTHELGPIAKVLKINSGNRLVSLTSTSSKAAGLRDYIKEKKPDDEELKNTKFAQGDIVTTVIKCSGGETIVLTLDTTLPRYYSRGFTVRGSKGMYEEATDSVFLDREEDIKLDFTWKDEQFKNAEKYAETYTHPIWKKYGEKAVLGGHDGMDWIEFNVFFDCLENNEPMPVDVYDAATWMSITALSEQSISNGSAPVGIPDFTRGKWLAD